MTTIVCGTRGLSRLLRRNLTNNQRVSWQRDDDFARSFRLTQGEQKRFLRSMCTLTYYASAVVINLAKNTIEKGIDTYGSVHYSWEISCQLIGLLGREVDIASRTELCEELVRTNVENVMTN